MDLAASKRHGRVPEVRAGASPETDIASPQSLALFDFYEDDPPSISIEASRKESTQNNLRRKPNDHLSHVTSNTLTPITSRVPSVNSPSSAGGSFKNLEDILKFPVESSHAYSYAHLSPNSMALRLNVLKRSLEILKDHPELFKSYHLAKVGEDNTRSLLFRTHSNNSSLSIHEKQTSPMLPPPSFYTHTNNSQEILSDSNKNYKLQSNASSAALAALFRPQFKRSDSFPVNQVYGGRQESNDKRMLSLNVGGGLSVNNFTEALLNNDLEDLILLLESDRDFLAKNTDIASTLHHLSLSHNKDEEESRNLKNEALKNKLLYALATPFVENLVQTGTLLQNDGSVTPRMSYAPSSMALNMLNSPNPQGSNSSRPFHQMASGKHSAPQSVFTVEIDNPWSVKAANDLACLMFGVLKNMIKSLTLMDLIAPQFRTFVTERLTNYISLNLDLSMGSKRKHPDNDHITNNNILFAGEIVAISRPGDQKFAWTSLWAKRKGNLIICMFDQIPCDAFDVVILCKKDSDENVNKSSPSSSGSSSARTYHINSINEVAGDLLSQQDLSNVNLLSDISQSLCSEIAQDLDELQANNEDEFLDYYVSLEVTDSERINKTRYYTIQFRKDENIPCAITSNPLEINDERYEIKLKIHSLPYIAGIFVIDSSSYKILSCNNAIARNLFGKSLEELNDQTIDNIIPQFASILDYGLKDQAGEFDMVPGLVLPEHFFRKYDSILRYQKGDCESGQTEEDLFFHSHGLKGLHRDGKTIYVDVQLRATTNDSLVIWITYSRKGNKSNISNELDKLNAEKALQMSKQRTKAASTIPEESTVSALKPPAALGNDKYTKLPTLRSSDGAPHKLALHWPSQLNLFDGEMSFDTSSNVMRKSSTRKARNDSFSIPVSFMNSSTFDKKSDKKPHALSKLYSSKNLSTDNVPHRDETSDEETHDGTETDAQSSSGLTIDTTHSSEPAALKEVEYAKFSEEEILKLENEMLEEKIEKSTHWPKEVGTMRRTKKFSEFKVLKDMGEGAYGKVVLVQHKEDPIYKIIIKCIDKERILVDTWVRDRKLGTIPSEIQIMAFLNNEPHPNIMRIIDFFEDSQYYYLETPIFGDPPAIDLFDYIEIKKNMSELECQFLFKQIVLSIYHLHQHGIVHRDIKDENVIVDENGIIKLIDFGSAAYTRQGPFDVFVGTIDYASPEVLRGEKYEGKPQDIWALGILLYTMLYKENPFYNVDEIMEGDLRLPYVVSQGLASLIKKILVRDIDLRPTITDIVEEAWLNV